MASYQSNRITHVSLKEAVTDYRYVNPQSDLVALARKVDIAFGD